jgi:hypothetical protein
MTKPQTAVRNQFKQAIARGTGDAFLIMEQNPLLDFSAIIIKAAKQPLSYDPQCEGCRTWYIHQLIKKSSKQEKIIAAVLQQLAIQKTDIWSLNQLCELALCFYKEGYTPAKKILKNRFLKNNINSYESCAIYEIIELEGVEGFLLFAEMRGKALKSEGDNADVFEFDHICETFKSLAIQKELGRAAKTNKLIAKYFKSIVKQKKIKPSPPIGRFSYALLKEKIDRNAFRVISTERANELTVKEIKQLASDFLNEKDKAKIELYLRFFAKRKFPFDYEPLLKIAKGRNAPCTRLIEFAVYSLQYFHGKDIRELALHKFSSIRNPYLYIPLLFSNYKKGDHTLLEKIVRRSTQYHFLHSLMMGYVEIFNANPTPDCRASLEYLYHHSNCGICRERVVKCLYNNGVLSEKILNEIQFDSNKDIRKKYKWIIKNNGKRSWR